jgi:hypothetical protein
MSDSYEPRVGDWVCGSHWSSKTSQEVGYKVTRITPDSIEIEFMNAEGMMRTHLYSRSLMSWKCMLKGPAWPDESTDNWTVAWFNTKQLEELVDYLDDRDLFHDLVDDLLDALDRQ